eukprot:2496055-Prymnesium_polylepis.1
MRVRITISSFDDQRRGAVQLVSGARKVYRGELCTHAAVVTAAGCASLPTWLSAKTFRTDVTS